MRSRRRCPATVAATLAAMLGCAGLARAHAEEALPGLPRLAGIVIAPGSRIAIFEAAEGLATAVEEGEQVAGYTVRLIRPDGVQIEGDGRSVTLAPAPRGAGRRATPADTGGVTFGLVVNPPAPAPD